MIIGWLLLAGVFSFFAVSAVYGWARRAHILDIPNERSSHSTPTPVAGGLAISGITLVGLASYWLFQSAFYTSELVPYLVGALLVGSISFVDDLYSTSRSIRLAFHLVAAILVSLFIGTIEWLALPWGGSIDTGYLALPLGILWVVGVTNAYNFMDGVDGMAGTQAVVIGLAWASTCWLLGLHGLSFAALLVACASLGFLVHNWPPARIFMGDVGSVFLGYTFSIMALMTAQLDERLLVAGAVFLAPLLFDTSWTLLRRLWRGENLLQAHRTHLYQRMAAAGYSHRIVTLIYGTAAIVSSAGAILWLLGARRGETIMGAAVVLPCCAIWGLTLWIESRVRSLATESSQAHQSLRSEVSGERLFSLWSFFSGVGQRLGVVWIALISALIIRFLWMTSVEGAVTPQTYWTYVNASLEAFTGSLMPTTILGLAVFGGFEIFSRSRKQKSRKLFFTLLPYSIFFPAILLYRLLPIENSHFPRLTWVVAWAISVVIVATGLLIENLQERNKKEESHSVASEIIIDGILIALAFSGAYLVRFETLPLPDPFQQQLFLLLPYVVLSGIVFNCSWGVYSLLRRFTGIRDSLVIAQSVASLAFLFLLLRIALFQSHELLRIP
ncbi:MAG TPA: glycosyltransferase family 4 protein, partial [Acidobacteriota bacterium]|nr:glycosyltransferase family 4 protein [Acidobacteriota bacterium]